MPGKAVGVPHFEGRLQTVVVGIAIVIDLHDVSVLRESSAKRLAGGVARVCTDWTRIEITPVHQIAASSTDISDRKGHSFTETLLDGQIVSVVHWSRELLQDLDHIKGRVWGGTFAGTKNIDTRRHANEYGAKRVWLRPTIENLLVTGGSGGELIN